MMKKKIFIDGGHGTTGLEFLSRLQKSSLSNQIEILTIPVQHQKKIYIKKEIYKQSDLVVLCLPDEAAQKSVEILSEINEGQKKIINCLDASSAHRIDSKWTYGFSQIKGQYEKIKASTLVSNPGCYASGFITLIRPLVESKLLSPDFPVTAYGFSGYSGGGKSLIEYYEKKSFKVNGVSSNPLSFLPYALSLEHKHLPEMQKYSLLDSSPFFQPAVLPLYEGMFVSVPLHYEQLQFIKNNPQKIIKECYEDYYNEHTAINVIDLKDEELVDDKFLDITKNNNNDNIDIIITGNEHLNLFARLNNLGKGAAGAAIENIKIMLDME